MLNKVRAKMCTFATAASVFPYDVMLSNNLLKLSLANYSIWRLLAKYLFLCEHTEKCAWKQMRMHKCIFSAFTTDLEREKE